MIKLSQSSSLEEEIFNRLPISDNVLKIMQLINKKNGMSLIVGGSIRDAIFSYYNKKNITLKDIDIECYGITQEELNKILSAFGKIDQVGKSFGVTKLTLPEYDEQLDFALPRTEKRQLDTLDHTGFDISVDPNLAPEVALTRRDFTMNAIGFDPLTKKIYDYYGGVEDIKNKTLKHVKDETFIEDPLRVLRAFQFIARFGLEAAPETINLCNKMLSNAGEYTQQKLGRALVLSDLFSKERVEGEFSKFALKSKFPKKSLEFLVNSGWIKLFPVLDNLIGLPQEPSHHPEGDVFEHTKHSLEAANKLADKYNLHGNNRIAYILSVLLHDVGKVSTTETNNGKISTYGHDEAAVPIVRQFLHEINMPNDIITQVIVLVKNHMRHINYNQTNPSPRAVNRLIKELIANNADMNQLMAVIEADHSGRPPLPPELPIAAQKILDTMQTMGVGNEGIQLEIDGRDILNAGFPRGAIIGEVKRLAEDEQASGKFTDKISGQAWLSNLYNEYIANGNRLPDMGVNKNSMFNNNSPIHKKKPKRISEPTSDGAFFNSDPVSLNESVVKISLIKLSDKETADAQFMNKSRNGKKKDFFTSVEDTDKAILTNQYQDYTRI